MKKLLQIIALCAALVTVSSCFATLALTSTVLSNIVPGEKVTLKGETIQQVGDTNQSALMKTDSDATVCIVYDFGTYKDGKRIRDRFVRAGMYRYNSPSGTELYAPIFIRKKDYKKLWPVAVQLDAQVQSHPGQETNGQPELYI